MGKSDAKPQHFFVFEQKIIENFNRISTTDMASIISGFLSQNYVPRSLLQELNQLNNLNTFNKASSLLILENLARINYTEKPEIYEKLLNQLRRLAGSGPMNQIVSYRLLDSLNKLKNLFPNQDYTDLAQIFLDKQVEYIRHQSVQIHGVELFNTVNIVKELAKFF